MHGHSHTIVIEPEEDGSFHSFCPALPGCHSQGDTFEEAGRNINEAIALYVESLQAHGENGFDPSTDSG